MELQRFKHNKYKPNKPGEGKQRKVQGNASGKCSDSDDELAILLALQSKMRLAFPSYLNRQSVTACYEQQRQTIN